MDSEPKEPKKDDYTKPSYDARQVYYTKVVIPMLAGIAQAIINHDTPSWLSNIEGLFDITFAFLKEPEKVLELINDFYRQLDEANRFQDNKNKDIAYWALQRPMHILTRQLMIAAKDMFLPSQAIVTQEFNWDEFKSKSDL